jgi:hypothetical protein
LATLITSDADPDAPAPRLFRGASVAATIAKRAGAVPALLQLRDNTSTPFGIAILPGYEPALPSEFTRLLASGRADVLRLLGVHYALLSAADDTPPPPLAALDLWTTPFPGARLYRIHDPLPRAYVAQNITPVSNGADLAAAFAGDLLDGRRALVSDSTLRLPPSTALRGSCNLDQFRSHELRATCSSAGPGLAVFVEQWAPGWRATVDGVDAPVVRANFACRAVPIPAGTHQVVLRYVPPGLAAGLTLSMGSALALIVSLLLTRPRHSTSPVGHR